MEKVKLPKEVAEAIETLRADGWETGAIIREMYSPNHGQDELDTIHEFAYQEDNYWFEQFLKALVNGYEVEQTPEDKIKALYDMSEAYAFKQGIIATLACLCIKIEGVNT